MVLKCYKLTRSSPNRAHVCWIVLKSHLSAVDESGGGRGGGVPVIGCGRGGLCDDRNADDTGTPIELWWPDLGPGCAVSLRLGVRDLRERALWRTW